MDLATSPQLDLGLDSLGWIDLTLALQQAFGISLTEQQIPRVITIGDLLREAMAAQANRPLPRPEATPKLGSHFTALACTLCGRRGRCRSGSPCGLSSASRLGAGSICQPLLS